MNALIEGAHGVISVAANVIPKSISQICKHIRENNISEAKKLNEVNNNIYRLLFIESNPIPVKWMLTKMGMIENSIRLPLIELDETYHDEILSELSKLKLI
jgi:dihydrodipicolinate synthase/N-acetylneuraminate lyase